MIADKDWTALPELDGPCTIARITQCIHAESAPPAQARYIVPLNISLNGTLVQKTWTLMWRVSTH